MTPYQIYCPTTISCGHTSDLADTVEPVTCSTWGCDQIGYLVYWFGHLPSDIGCGSDAVASNWWKYFVDPALALDPAAPCQ